MFGAYDHTNDKMHVHCYKMKNGHQFIDFLKRVEKRYDITVKNIFVVLDNLSVHKSKKVQKRYQILSTNKICIPTCKVTRTQFN